jgi:membrane protein
MKAWALHLLDAARVGASSWSRHATSQFAAAIAYRVLFSIVPLLTLVVVILDLVLPSDARADTVDWLFGALPGNEVEESINRSVRSASLGVSAVGVVSLGVLLWSASGMMASLRAATRMIWEAEAGRPFIGGKLIDLGLVVGAGVLLLATFGLSVIVQIIVSLGRDASGAIGLGSGRVFAVLVEESVALAVSFVVFLLLYRLLPPVRVQFRDLWPGALVAAVGLQLGVAGFAAYLRFSDFNAIYGPLTAVFGLLVLVYLAAVVLLAGAEVAAAWPRVARSDRESSRTAAPP